MAHLSLKLDGLPKVFGSWICRISSRRGKIKIPTGIGNHDCWDCAKCSELRNTLHFQMVSVFKLLGPFHSWMALWKKDIYSYGCALCMLLILWSAKMEVALFAFPFGFSFRVSSRHLWELAGSLQYKRCIKEALFKQPGKALFSEAGSFKGYMRCRKLLLKLKQKAKQ